MKAALSLLALVLTGCGGGGGGSSGGAALPMMAAPAAVESKPAFVAPPVPPLAVWPVGTGCGALANNRIFCELLPGDHVGLQIPAGAHGVFTNNTGAPLRIEEVSAYTGERMWWSEYCVYLGELKLGQAKPGTGEVGCATKQIAEDYAPIRWGAGIVVAPGGQVILNAHTEPGNTAHVYSMKVTAQATGLASWRQPQQDEVIPCDESQQHTAWSPIRNETGHTLQITGVSIYSENAGQLSAPNTVAAACLYVFNADSSLKHQNCDDRLRTRGDMELAPVAVEPGEYVVAQAVNSCKRGPAGYTWDWAAWIRMEGNAS